MLPGKPDVETHHPLEFLRRTPISALYISDHAIKKLLFKEFDDLAGEVFLRFEMAIEGPPGEPGDLSDLRNRAPFVPFLDKEPHACVEESFRGTDSLF